MTTRNQISAAMQPLGDGMVRDCTGVNRQGFLIKKIDPLGWMHQYFLQS